MTAKIVIRKKTRANGKYPLMLRVSHKGKTKVFTLKHEVDIANWDTNASRYTPNHRFKDENFKLKRLENKANDIIINAEVEGTNLTLEGFANSFNGTDYKCSDNAIPFFEELIKEQEDSNKLSNAKAYKDTLRALVAFGGKDIPFKSITPIYLNKWEVFLRKRGNTNGGIAFKMRELRAMINKAINRGIIDNNQYPFKAYKIAKLKHTPEKRALSDEEIRRIKNLDLSEQPELEEARRFFLFSFYTWGMNFIDMMHLKWSDIRNNKIFYRRSKTGTLFEIEILPPVQAILQELAKKKVNLYVFPILLHEDLSPKQIQYRKHKVLSKYNRKLKQIGELANLKGKLTSYVARHSFATVLKKKRIPVEVIAELMGHQSPLITQAYLKSFDKKTLHNEVKVLLDI